MARCSICGEEIPPQEVFRHRRERHPEMAQASARRGLERIRAMRAGQHEKPGEQPGGGKGRRAHALTPVNAALVEFASQTFIVPNTPALTYGYLCARKLGFEGDMALFLQEVIDDFYHRRDVNYYEEVMGWQEIGSVLGQPGAGPSQNGREAASPTGTGPR